MPFTAWKEEERNRHRDRFFFANLYNGLGLVELIDVKGIDVAQPMWP